MKLRITADNYEEIMFRLVEDDFDEATRKELLAQIEADPLFRFEWESWQKTVFTDPIEKYVAEGSALTEKITQIADRRVNSKWIYYYLAAASLALLMVSWFLLNTELNKSPEKTIAGKAAKPEVLHEKIVSPEPQVQPISNPSGPDQNGVELSQNETFRIADDTSKITNEKYFTEIPVLIDSVPVQVITLAESPARKSRYSVTVETNFLTDNNPQKPDIAQNRNFKYDKVLTNPRLYLLRKPNGEPDRLVLMGEDDNYLCLKLNYVEK